ncbi:DUF1579 domain-containing protein [Cognatiluteimonas weifangensis]|uniref:DUF1579 domain-containing protein n=1 Tax=Cognatiluteimonas weifangensis TaxID=2303539 RepID=A0A372DN11_9GAMM|nr:DUF1579 domain-containing protein [Luteimonas weifangensis]RFP60874.1 DUF1579 domain-containing protein [Luteimonas weifangensis]
MHRMLAAALLPLSLAAALPALAQDAPPQLSPEEAAMMQAYQQAGTPGAAHAALAKTVGDYTLSIRSWNAPDAPPTVETGTATRSMVLGGRVLVEQVQSQMYGQPFTGHGMHGYDNVTGKHWATWNDSMSTGLMVSEGSCDDAGACSFTGSWNDPVTKGRITTRMTSRWTSPTVEVFEMYGPGPDGQEMKMMEITYTRQ